MLEAEIKFRLKRIELDYYVVYTKNYQKSEMLREQKRENHTSALKSSLHTLVVLVVWGAANKECSLCQGPCTLYLVSQNNPRIRSQEGATYVTTQWGSDPDSTCHTARPRWLTQTESWAFHKSLRHSDGSVRGRYWFCHRDSSPGQNHHYKVKY